jgi:hemerythrin-like domain-containing protein
LAAAPGYPDVESLPDRKGSVAMVEALRRLHLEHAGMTRVLQVIESELAKLSHGEAPDFELLGKCLEYLLDFPAQCHHPKEDLIYRRLRDYHQVADKVLDDIVAEHETLAEKCTGLGELVERFRRAGAVTGKEVLRAGRDFLAFYRQHIEHEERGFFPTALECLTEDDWSEIDGRVVDREDPVFGESAEAGFAVLREEILRRDRETVG